MTYFKDFTKYEYFLENNDIEEVNIGWLSKGYKYDKGVNDHGILDLLWSYCTISINQTRGLHECDLCNCNKTINEERNGLSLQLGSAEIRVFGKKGLVFSSPNLIYHYVLKHNYKLPIEFVEAMKYCPKPTTKKNIETLNNYNYIWNKTLIFNGEEKRFKFVKTKDGLIKKVQI